ncbi:MAG TPA: decarboxylating 6-phosphogluconate dehydrogenase [Anaerolineales bacterium]|nr:decarboxylating 6-phosphogluconate dehydrogenase [Anaerolineales bacterium]
MQLTIIGLGKMGANMARRLLRAGHDVIGTNRSHEIIETLTKEEGMTAATSVADAVMKMSKPRAAWVMVPSGDPTEDVIDQLAETLSAGDIVIDGGNSNYKETMRRAEKLAERGIVMLDSGTSGGIWGLAEGYSLMIGGPQEAVERLRPVFETLAPAPDKGWGRVGPSGSGHFVKMVHNGIEYGMMQAFAEGFDILRAKREYEIDLHDVARIWQHGSVVRSWLLDLTAAALEEDQELADIKPWVADSGEGRWTVFESIDLDVPAPVITLALQMRLASRDEYGYAARMLAAMRNQFGGHAVKKA